MSRIGKKPILIPEGVEVKIRDNKVSIKGPKGELEQGIRPEVRVEIRDFSPPSAPSCLSEDKKGSKEILVTPNTQTKKTKSLWGLTRTLLSNMIRGVTEGYEKKLEIEGVGYKANLEGEDLVLQVGFSHPVKIRQPAGIKFLVEKNIITVSGIDKELVGQIAAKIRAIKPPEPYKGKGIRYVGEEVRRKVGKKAVTTEGTGA